MSVLIKDHTLRLGRNFKELTLKSRSIMGQMVPVNQLYRYHGNQTIVKFVDGVTS